MRRLLLTSLVLVGCGRIAQESSPIDGVDGGAAAPSEGTHGEALAIAARLAPEELGSFLAPTTEGLRREGDVITSPAERARSDAFDGVGARLPGLADGAFSVGLSRIPRFRASLRFDGAAATPAEVHEGRVIYPDAWVDTDLLMVAGLARLESLFLVRSAAAPTTWSLSMTLPTGVADVREERVTDGVTRLTLLDRAGEPVLYLPQPWAADARGRKRAVEVSFARPSASRLALTYRLDARALDFPVLVDPSIESSAWTAMASSATQGSIGHSMAYDPDRKVVVLYSGSTVACGSCNETWEYAAGAWSKKCSSCAPGTHGGAGMAYDSVGKRMILALGGGTTEIWAWKASVWTKLPITADATRERFGFGIAPGKSEAAVFGGVTTTSYPNASIDLATGWQPSIPFSVPSTPRAGSPITWDSKNGYFVLFSGSTGTADTWSLTAPGGNWDVHSPSVSPAARVDHGLAFDSVRGKTVLFGGVVDKKTWEFDGTNWVEMTPSTSPNARRYGTLAFMADTKRVLLYGGADTGGMFTVDTWEYHARGGACSADAQCDTGHCVDGVCCETASCGACEACDTATLPGVCSKVISAEDADTCAGTKSCDAAGACKLKLAQPCAVDADCALAHCVDGVCCATTCGVCSSCAINKGTCSAVTSAQDPDNCTGDKSCDASGACKVKNGASCAVATDCASGYCVEGVCCESLCNGQCETCAAAGTAGTCTALLGAPVGGRPLCNNPGTTCGGACDGKNRLACIYLDASTKCGAQCVGATYAESLCDGAGGCVQQTPRACLGSLKCDAAGAACLTSCAKDADCANSLICGTDGLCVPNAASCDGDHTTTDARGITKDCYPYRCESDGTCPKSCAITDDCVSGYVCDGTACVVPTAQSSGDAGGCAVQPGEARSGTLAGLGLALALAGLARRRTGAWKR